MAYRLTTPLFKTLRRWNPHISKRLHSEDLKYDLSEDIVTTTYKNILLLGINLPDASNAMDDNALVKLNKKLEDFSTNDQFAVAILFGTGGNFCTGIQKGADIKKAKKIIKTIQNLKKPTIATLTGFTTFFGFELAITCDFRIMELGSVCGFTHKMEKYNEVDIDVCKRILTLTNLAATLYVFLSGGPIDNSSALSYGLVNQCVECGTGLSRSIQLGTSMAKYPLEDVIKMRNTIYSLKL